MTTGENESWDLVVFSDDWGRRPSAPQHLGRCLAQARRVLWVEPAGLRRPRLNSMDLRRGLEKLKGAVPRVVPDRRESWIPRPASLTRLVPPVLPAYGIPPVRAANDALMSRLVREGMKAAGVERPVVITTIPTMAGVLGTLGERLSLYLRMDDFGLWPGYDHDAIRERESALLTHVDAVVAPSTGLLDVPGSSERMLIPHGVDTEHFGEARGEDPLIETSGPRVLVTGRLDQRLDYELMARVLEKSAFQLVLLGEAVSVPEELMLHPRVHMRPAVPYRELPRWLHSADLLWMPYARTELGHSLAPLKTRELLATGKPVVATSSRGTAEDNEIASLLLLADDAETTLSLMKDALDEPQDSVEARVESTRSMSWMSRSRALSELVERLLTSRDS